MLSGLYIRKLKITGEIPDDSYLSKLPVINAVKKMGGLEFASNVTFLVGENGVGKSTLTEALAVSMGFNPEGGTKNFMFSTENTHSELYKYVTVSKGTESPKDGFFLRAESFYNAASYVDELFEEGVPDCYGGKSLHGQSHGESFLTLVENRFFGNGLYIMDEPEAALSPMRQLELMCHIDRLVKANSQLIISTHSPMLMAYPGAEVFEIAEDGISKTDYRETEHFRVMKSFLDAPERTLKYLLA